MHPALNANIPNPGFSRPGCPLVSVIIPYYKQERFLAETVQSVRQQTYPNFEIIVVDDGSPVPAISVLLEKEDVLVVRMDHRGCPAATRNLGFRRSSGEYLVFLDGDDRLTPEALQVHVKALTARPDAALSFGAQRIIDEAGNEVRPAHTCRPRKNYFLMLLEGNPIGCPGATMIRRDAFIEAGLFDESFQIVEDHRLYLRLARRHPFVRNEFCVADYRFHSNSLSRNRDQMLTAILEVLDRVEVENTLTAYELRRLRHGRRRWIHEFHRADSLAYRMHGLYFKLRAISGVPLRSYLRRPCSEETLPAGLQG